MCRKRNGFIPFSSLFLRGVVWLVYRTKWFSGFVGFTAGFDLGVVILPAVALVDLPFHLLVFWV